MFVLGLVLYSLSSVCVASTVFALATDPPGFTLGFMALADQIPSIVGQPLGPENYGANGDSLQQTTTGLMVWRKADNWTAFTDGSRTWINGPYGVQVRDNVSRFDWEAPAAHAPTPLPTSSPTYVDSAPSEYDLYRSESIAPLGDGHNVLRISLANRNHYWTAGDIRVSVNLLDGGGRVVAEGQATGDATCLGPQQSSAWEYVLPGDGSWQKAVPAVLFRWVSPGG